MAPNRSEISKALDTFHRLRTRMGISESLRNLSMAARVFTEIGDLDFQQFNFDRALDAYGVVQLMYEKMAEFYSIHKPEKLSDALYNKAQCFKKMGLHGEYIACLGTAMHLNRDNYDAVFETCEVFLGIGFIVEAFNVLSTILSLERIDMTPGMLRKFRTLHATVVNEGLRVGCLTRGTPEEVDHQGSPTHDDESDSNGATAARHTGHESSTSPEYFTPPVSPSSFVTASSSRRSSISISEMSESTIGEDTTDNLSISQRKKRRRRRRRLMVDSSVSETETESTDNTSTDQTINQQLSKKDQQKQDYRRQKEAENIRESLLEQSRKEEERQQKQKEKEMEKQAEQERLRRKEFVATLKTQSILPKKKHKTENSDRSDKMKPKPKVQTDKSNAIPPKDGQPSVPACFSQTYAFRLACNQCYISMSKGQHGVRYTPDMDHKCARNILMVASKALQNDWVRIRPRPKMEKMTSSRHFSGNFRFCRQYESGEKCTLGESNCTFCHSKDELAIWTMDLNDEEFKLQTFINDQQKWALKQDSLSPVEEVSRKKIVPVITERKNSLPDVTCPFKLEELCGSCLGMYGTKAKRKGQYCSTKGITPHLWATHSVFFLSSSNETIRPPKKGIKIVQCPDWDYKCDRGNSCHFSHGEEFEVWTWMKENNVTSLADVVFLSSKSSRQTRNMSVIALSKIPHLKPYSPVKKPKITDPQSQFHCNICNRTLVTQTGYDQHCLSAKHEENLSIDREKYWNYRPPPWGGNYKLCQGLGLNNGNCPYTERTDMYNRCQYAHSQPELDEWIERDKYRNMRKKMMTTRGTFSYIHCLQDEYSSLQHQSDMMCTEVDGIDVEVDNPVTFYSEKNDSHHQWTILIKSKECLIRASLLHNESRLHFKLVTEETDSRMEQAGQIEEGKKFLINKSKNQDCTYKVKIAFNGGMFGSLKQTVVLDFGSRPLLVVHLNAEIGHDFKGEVQTLRSEPSSKRPRWTSASHRIIPFCDKEGDRNEALLTKYKAPDSRIFSLDSLRGDLSRNNYIERIHQLIKMEELQCSRILAKLKVEEEVQLSGKIQGTSIVAGDNRRFCRMTLVNWLTEDSDMGHLVLSGSAKAWVAPPECPSKTVYEAEIVREANFGFCGKERGFIYLCLSKRCCNDLSLLHKQSCRLEIQLQIDRLPFCRMHQGVDHLRDTTKVFPDIAKYEEGDQKPKATVISSDYFNGTQKEIIQHMLTVYNMYCLPTVIYGPFGCGKSETLGRGTLEVYKNRPGSKVLICTLNDSASDIFITRYFKSAAKAKEILRIYSPDRDVATISPELRPYCLYSIDRKSFRLPTKDDLAQRRIVVTSLSTSQYLADLEMRGIFTHIIIDEAGQCLECEAVMALSLATDSTCVLLAGDHRQLSPKSFSKSILPKRTRLLHESPLIRLYRYYQNYASHMKGQFDKILKVNYRSHEKIISFISQEFYEGAVEAKSGWSAETSSVPALQFHSTSGNESCGSAQTSTSYYNAAEVEETVQLVDNLYNNWPKEWGERNPQKIACITPYTQQINLLMKRLSNKDKLYGKIKVSLLEDIQGEEYFAVFISTVRTHMGISQMSGTNEEEQENMGFFSDVSLLNTAMTRAKCLVSVIGNPVSLSALGPCQNIWRTYLMECKAMNTLFPQSTTIQSIHNQASLLKKQLSDNKSLSSLRVLRQDICDMKEMTANDVIKQLIEKHEIDQPTSSQMKKDDVRSNCKVEIIEEDEQTIYRYVSSDDVPPKKRTRWRKLFVDLPYKRINHNSDDDDDEDELMDEGGIDGGAYRQVIYQDIAEEELIKYIKRDTTVYKHCEMVIEGSSRMQALNIDRRDKVHTIGISSRIRCNRAFHGDEVIVELLSMGKPNVSSGDSIDNLPQGRVLGILKRSVNPRKELYVCRVDPYNTNMMLPLNRGVPKLYNLVREGQQKKGYVIVYRFTKVYGSKRKQIEFDRYEEVDPINPSSKLFVVKFLKWEAEHYSPLGIVIDVLPVGSSIEDGEAVLNIEYNLREKFQDRTCEELERMYDENFTLPQDVKSERLDYTDKCCFTIDPPGSQDLDDALSVDISKERIRVGIHIADVGYFVPKDSAIDREAGVRCQTFYPVKGKPVGMLPPTLSNNLCSLVEGRDRFTMSVFIDLDHSYELIPGKEQMIEPTIIQNSHRFTYDEVQQILHDRSVTVPNECEHKIRLLHVIAKKWRLERLGNSANYIQSAAESRSDAHRLVEEMMIRANHEIAFYLKKTLQRKTPLRIQPLPKENALTEWYENHQLDGQLSLGLGRALHGLVNKCLCQSECVCFSPPPEQFPVLLTRITLERIKDALDNEKIGDLQNIFMKTTLFPQTAVAEFAFQDIQEKGKYQCSGDLNWGNTSFHSSLNLDPYTHFTSPIRRYIDLVVNRLLHDLKAQTDVRYSEAQIRQICDKSNQVLLKEKRYSRAKEELVLNVILKNNPIIVYPVVDKVDDNGYGLRYPFIKNLSSASRQVAFTELNLRELPVYDEKDCSAILKWNERIYDYKKRSAEQPRVRVLSREELLARSMKSLGFISLDSARFVVNIPFKIWHNIQRSLREEEEQGIKDASVEIVKTANVNSRNLRKVDISSEAGPNKSIQLNVNFQMVLRPTQVHRVQLMSEVDRGRLATKIQLLNLSDAFDICVEHNQNPIKCFATSSVRMASQLHDIRTYRKCWEPLIDAETAIAAIKEHENFIINNVQITWSQKQQDDTCVYSGVLKMQSKFCEERNIFDVDTIGDTSSGSRRYICVRYSNVPCNKTLLEDVEVDPAYVDDCICFVAHCLVEESPKIVKDEYGEDILELELQLHQSSAPFPKILLKDRLPATIQVLSLSVSHMRMLGAVKGLETSCELVKSVALGKPEKQDPNQEIRRSGDPNQNIEENMRKPDYVKGMVKANEKQQEAINRALRSPFTLIHGPPGTGKTITGARIAYIYSNLNRMAGENKKVLYCGPSNKAVDVVVGNLKQIQRLNPGINQTGTNPKSSGLRIVRIYGDDVVKLEYPLPTNPHLPRRFASEKERKNTLQECCHLDVSLHYLIRDIAICTSANDIKRFDKQFRELTEKLRMQNFQWKKEEKLEIKKKVKRYQKLVAQAKREVLQNTDIVLTTCTGLSEERFTEMFKIDIKQVIIDEAGMCTEPEALIPLVASKPAQVVMIGDHKQLRPIVLSEMAQRLGMKKSLFERYVKPGDMLTTQYRMHEAIAAFPSEAFYDNKLRNGLGRQSEPSRPPQLWPGGGSNPITFVDVRGEEKALVVSSREGNEQSKYNDMEAEYTVKVVSNMVKVHKIRQSCILVLTQYRAQNSKIMERLSHANLHNVATSTVVKSQGSECDYIVLSTVRSLADELIEMRPTHGWSRRYLGFAGDEHQINVAITRARHGLIIIGNQKLLSVCPVWDDLFEHYQQRRCIVTPERFNTYLKKKSSA